MIAHRTVFRRFLAELVLVVGMLAGCAGADGGDSFSQIQADENVQDIPERQDVPRIVVTYQTYQGSVLTDLDEVADAINEDHGAGDWCGGQLPSGGCSISTHGNL